MASSTRQVQQVNRDGLPTPDAVALFFVQSGPVDVSGVEGRWYPGEAEATFLLAYLNFLSPSDRRAFVRNVVRLQKSGMWGQKYRPRPAKEAERAANATYAKLMADIDWGKSVGIIGPQGKNRAGLVVLPPTRKGQAAFAVLLLHMKGRLRRIRRCLHCKAWFYARFKHQQFCSNHKTKCQFNHYHTPEWRKKHRKSNRTHQQNYRKRYPGRSR